MKAICVDSSFLIAYYDERDVNNSRAKEYFVKYFNTGTNQIIIPWPILYETISTRMVRNWKRMVLFQRGWGTLNEQRRLILLDDSPFREKSIAENFEELKRRPPTYRALSLADRIIRNMLSDINIKIDFFITFNQKDFIDVCKRFRRIIV